MRLTKIIASIMFTLCGVLAAYQTCLGSGSLLSIMEDVLPVRQTILYSLHSSPAWPQDLYLEMRSFSLWIGVALVAFGVLLRLARKVHGSVLARCIVVFSLESVLYTVLFNAGFAFPFSNIGLWIGTCAAWALIWAFEPLVSRSRRKSCLRESQHEGA